MYIDIVFGIYLLALLTIISSYLHAAERSVFAAAFQGSSFGARFALALFATIAATMYSRLQRGKNRDLRTTREQFGLLTLVPDVQTLSPYWELQKQGARADSTILLPKHSFPIFSLIPLLRRRNISLQPWLSRLCSLNFLSSLCLASRSAQASCQANSTSPASPPSPYSG